jgi:hypothetical protein
MSAGRTVNSQSQHWGTPKKYVDAVRDVFEGEIDLDPCSNEYSIVKANTEYRLPEKDGLKESWNFKKIYVNPPYGTDRKRGTKIKNWFAKCVAAHKDYNSEIIALVPVATNTRHWKDAVFGKATSVCFLYDTRLKFLINGIEEKKGAPMACAMIYWGVNYESFYNTFINHGAVINISNLHEEKIAKERTMITLKL